MYCRKCGSKVEDGARFCAVCGAPVADGAGSKEGAAAPQPADTAAEVDLDDLAAADVAATDGPDAKPAAGSIPSAAGADARASQASTAAKSTDPTNSESLANAASAKPKRSKKPIAIAALVVALAAAGGGAGYYFGIYRPEQARQAAQEEALAAKHAVRFSVSAEGWDTSAGASRLPLHITGREERGKKVDTVAYVDSKGDGVKLRRGRYRAEVAASPIAADGTVYAVPGDGLDLKLSEKATEKKTADGGSVKLDQVAAADVTDDEISAAKKYAEEDKSAKKAGFNIDAETLAQAATKRRDDAVAAKQAEEEAKRQAEEEAKKAAEAKQARTIDTDDYTMVLPDWFPIDEFEITKTSSDYQNALTVDVSRTGTKKSDGSANFLIYSATEPANGIGPVFFRNLGKTSNGRIVELFGGSMHENKAKESGVEADDALGMSAEDYANTLASCITLK